MANKNIWTGEGYLWGNDEKDPYGSLNPEQRQVNAALGNTLMGNMNQNFNYGGQLTAPIGAGEQDVVNQNSRINAVAGNTYSNLGNYDDASFNTNFNNEIADPTFADFKNNIEPLLGEELPSFGTQRANVIARAAGDLQGKVLNQRFTARESAKDRALTALTGANNYFQGAAGVQAIPREITQAGLDREYQNFVTANQQKQNSLQQALAFLGLSTGTFQQGPNPYEIAIGAAKAGAQVAAAA